METKEIKLSVKDKLNLKRTRVEEKQINNLVQLISTDGKANVEIERKKGSLTINLKNGNEKYIIYKKDTKRGKEDIRLVNGSEKVRIFNNEGKSEISLYLKKILVEATIEKQIVSIDTFENLVNIIRTYEDENEISNVASYLQEKLGDMSFLDIIKEDKYHCPIEKAVYKNMRLESISYMEYMIDSSVNISKEVYYNEEELQIKYVNTYENIDLASIIVDADWVKFEVFKEAETNEWYRNFKKVSRNLIKNFEYSMDSFIKGAIKRKTLGGRLKSLIFEEEDKITSLFEEQKISQ